MAGVCPQARPKPKGEAFEVKQSDKFLTIPDDVVLHGEERSKRRAEFDAAMAEKERRQKVWTVYKSFISHLALALALPTGINPA